MRANGVDPNLIQQAIGGMMDPANRFTLYKTESGSGRRIILLQKNHTGSFGSKKDSRWLLELVPDKMLPPGEYTFSALDMSGGSALLIMYAVPISSWITTTDG